MAYTSTMPATTTNPIPDPVRIVCRNTV